MIEGFWIVFCAILGVMVYFLVQVVRLKRAPRWGLVLTEHLVREQLSIPIGNAHVLGYLYTSIDFKNYAPMPGVIVLPRRDEKYPAFEHWGAHFALQGYPTLCLEMFNKTTSREAFVAEWLQKLPSIKKVLSSDPRVDPCKIVLVGFEDSAEVALRTGLPDDDVKVICGVSMFHVAPEYVTSGQEKVFLAHCKDDDQATLAEFRQNCDLLHLTPREYLLLDLGGHHVLSQEATIAAFMSIQIKLRLNPPFKQILPEITLGEEGK